MAYLRVRGRSLVRMLVSAIYESPCCFQTCPGGVEYGQHGWTTVYYLSRERLGELSGARYRRLCQCLGVDPAGAVVKFSCDICQNYYVDLGRLDRVSGKRASYIQSSFPVPVGNFPSCSRRQGLC